MSKTRKFAGKAAIAVGISMLLGVSAFGETRHRNETRGRSEGGRITRERSVQSTSRSNVTVTPARESRSSSMWAERARAATQHAQSTRTQQRSTVDRSRSTTRSTTRETWNRNDSRDRSRYDSRNRSSSRDRYNSHDRYDSRNRSNRDWQRSSSRSYSHRQPYYARGHVTRYVPYRGGYHVYVSGCSYPFFVPIAWFNSHHVRVGLSINLGGYYNPLGYYDYYDGPYYETGVRSDFRGVVEEVDYRNDRLVVRNEETGNFVTVNLGNRRYDDVRPGDFVEIEGTWTRSSVFLASYVRYIDGGRYDEYRR